MEFQNGFQDVSIVSTKIHFNFTAAVYSDTKKFLLIHLRIVAWKGNASKLKAHPVPIC